MFVCTALSRKLIIFSCFHHYQAGHEALRLPKGLWKKRQNRLRMTKQSMVTVVSMLRHHSPC